MATQPIRDDNSNGCADGVCVGHAGTADGNGCAELVGTALTSALAVSGGLRCGPACGGAVHSIDTCASADASARANTCARTNACAGVDTACRGASANTSACANGDIRGAYKVPIESTPLRSVWRSRRYNHAFVNYMAKKYRNRGEIKAITREIVESQLHAPRGDAEILRDVRAAIRAHSHRVDTSETGQDLRAVDRRRIMRLFCRHAATYLDFGCGDATITREIASAVGAVTAYGIDVYPVWSDGIRMHYGAVLADFRGVWYLQTQDMCRLPPKSVDLCTIFMTLHHLERPRAALKSLHRLLRDGARLVIREHDCQKNDLEFSNFLDVIHVYNCDDTVCYYSDECEWISLITDMGFRYVSSYYYCEPNPHRIFYACFVKMSAEEYLRAHT